MKLLIHILHFLSPILSIIANILSLLLNNFALFCPNPQCNIFSIMIKHQLLNGLGDLPSIISAIRSEAKPSPYGLDASLIKEYAS